jgi:hypothetical protein
MTCQGGALGYGDIWYLQRGHSLSSANGVITPEVLATTPTPSAAAPSAPDDRAALLQRIAKAVQGVLPMSSSLACDVVADAVLAVLPEPADGADLRRKLASSERIRENADFHLGQEMARRQLAEKETARLRAVVARLRQMTDHWEQQLPEVIRTPAVVSAIRAVLERAETEPSAPADRAAILLWAADRLDADMERFFSEWPDEPRNSPYALGRKDAADELRRMAVEAQQPEAEAPCCSDPTCRCNQVNAAGRCDCAKWDSAPAVEARQADTAGEQQ